MMKLTPEQLAYMTNMPHDEDDLKQVQAQHRQIIVENREKEKQRKARNHRLIKHGAVFESIFPQTAEMDDSAYAEFVTGLARNEGL